MLFGLILVMVLAMIIGGIFVLKRSAKKLTLTDEQLKEIHKRNEQFDQEDNHQR